MSSESKKPYDESRVTDATDERSQDHATIKDLSSSDATADNVRGGALPPSEKPGAPVLPPND